MDTRQTSRSILISGLSLLFVGWGGAALLFFFTLPTVWPRWGFLVLWTLGWIGVAMPIFYFFNLRFPSDPPAGANVILRQSIWAGLYWATLAWLQLGRAATPWVVAGLALGLIALEYLIRLRERSQWYPPAEEPSQPVKDESQTEA
jgi:hypothetical protein